MNHEILFIRQCLVVHVICNNNVHVIHRGFLGENAESKTIRLRSFRRRQT